MEASAASTAEDTRESLLAAAASVFAEQGFDGARVREIAQRAGANAAAISYHFGGKQELYREVLRRQAGVRIQRFPLPAVPPVQDEPEQALRLAIGALLSRFLSQDDSLLPRLMMREIAAPTAELEAMAREMIAPQFAQLGALIARCLGEAASSPRVQRCTFSLLSQCMFYLFARPLVGVLAPQTYEGDAIARLSAHIADFSLAALRGLRSQGVAFDE
ncbi:transcriptional regulator, TetR family [Solimonas aquatica]|uniref:Transcriptional regulator, TetR family n=1 Tax=Solimonas aquatica TaxID=489703 RepID=A0A1H9HAC2_9GAMM|nr:DUF1956 domain-containing protein [Solimonas aquatica]SEQ59280.1 transcriptional regulator, TetR family [Solimonas aquatica]